MRGAGDLVSWPQSEGFIWIARPRLARAGPHLAPASGTARWPVLRSEVDVAAAEFREKDAQMRAVVRDLHEVVGQVVHGVEERAKQRHLARGKLLARDRIDRLLDPSTPFLEFSQLAAYKMYGKDNVSVALASVHSTRACTVSCVTVCRRHLRLRSS